MTTDEVKSLVRDVNEGQISAERARRILASTRWRLQYDWEKEKHYVRALQGVPHYTGR